VSARRARRDGRRRHSAPCLRQERHRCGAGKGGVGKTRSRQLRFALAKVGPEGRHVDGASTGRNVPSCSLLQNAADDDGEKLIPDEKYGLQSVDGLHDRDDAPIHLRGTMLPARFSSLPLSAMIDLDYL